jgi:hypothetical protein
VNWRQAPSTPPAWLLHQPPRLSNFHTVPRGKLRPTLEDAKALLRDDREFVRRLIQAVRQELLNPR